MVNVLSKLDYKKRVIAIIFSSAILICVALIAVLLLIDANKSEDSQPGDNNNKVLNLKENIDTPFIATIDSTNNGQSYQQIIEQDGKGIIKISYTYEDEKIEIYVTNEFSIQCNNNDCVKTEPVDRTDPQIYYSHVVFDSAALDTLKETLSYVGQENCDVGTCDVYESEAPEGFTGSGKLFINSADNMLSKIETTVGENTSATKYEYRDVEISLPNITAPTTNN